MQNLCSAVSLYTYLFSWATPRKGDDRMKVLVPMWAAFTLWKKPILNCSNTSVQVFFTLPVIVLKCLVPQQQVPEAIARRKWGHLGFHLRHLKRGDIQNDARVTAVVLLHRLSGGPAGGVEVGAVNMSLAAVTVIKITTLAGSSGGIRLRRRSNKWQYLVRQETKI